MNYDLHVPAPSEVAEYGISVVSNQGVSAYCCGERPFWGPMYLFDPYEHRPWQDAVRCMYEDGVRMFSMLVSLGLVWDKKGEPYDFSLTDELFGQILEIAPDALLMPLFYVHTPNWWDECYPEELLKFKGNAPRFDLWGNEKQRVWKYEAKMYHSTRNPSLASKRWLHDSGQALAASVKHIEQRYPGHFLGYQLGYGTCGEWHTFGSYLEGRFGDYDFSEPMVARFRAFLRQRYASEDALRDAWQNKTVSFNNALPPDKLAKLSTDIGSLKIPSLHHQYRDWQDAYSQATVEAMEHFCRVAKENAPGPRVTTVFAGYQMQTGASAYLAHFGNNVMELAIKSPHIDILCTPNGYVGRDQGVFSQASVATIARHKLFLAQCDIQPPDWVTLQIDKLPVNEQEWVRMFNRDTFYNLTQGSGHLIFYDFGHGWFRNKEIRATIGTLCESFRNRLPIEKMVGADVAIVLDEESTRMVESCAGYYQQFKKMINHNLPLTGTPFDVIDISDVLAGKHPYKLYIFRDEFYADAERRADIRAVLERQKSSAVWFFAAGVIDEDHVDASLAESLTGIKMAMFANPVPQGLTLMSCEKDQLLQGMALPYALHKVEDLSTVYGPVLFCDDPAAPVLGQIESLEMPGMAIKRGPERFDLWSVSPLLPPDVLHRIMKAAGVWMYCDKPDMAMLYGSAGLLAVCPETSGQLSLNLPPQYHQAEDLGSGTIHEVGDGKIILNFENTIPVLLRLRLEKGGEYRM